MGNQALDKTSLLVDPAGIILCLWPLHRECLHWWLKLGLDKYMDKAINSHWSWWLYITSMLWSGLLRRKGVLLSSCLLVAFPEASGWPFWERIHWLDQLSPLNQQGFYVILCIISQGPSSTRCYLSMEVLLVVNYPLGQGGVSSQVGSMFWIAALQFLSPE